MIQKCFRCSNRIIFVYTSFLGHIDASNHRTIVSNNEFKLYIFAFTIQTDYWLTIT